MPSARKRNGKIELKAIFFSTHPDETDMQYTKVRKNFVCEIKVISDGQKICLQLTTILEKL